MENSLFIKLISTNLGIKDSSVKNTLQLLEVGATIPFIARYRKEKTGSLDEVQIADIQTQFKKLIELNNRKESILETIDEQGKLTNELKDKIIKSWNSIEIEDLYLPYKKRKKTRADIARENGLETLAELIMSQRGQDLYFAAGDCINEKVKTAEEAIQGAKDIIAEWISEDQDIRDKLRISFRRFGVLISKVVTKKKEDAEKYKDYFDFSGALFKCPSHRFLAILRGGNEGILKVSVQIEEDRALEMIERKFIKTNGKHGEYIAEAISDSYKRLIFPSIENQILNEYKEKADDEAIRVFGQNLTQLLLAPPLGQKGVMAIDPGFRSGCKVVCLDNNGDFLKYFSIFPHPPQNQSFEASELIKNLVHDYKIEAIGIGNGTASRETQFFILGIDFDHKVDVYMVNENGASIYSASEIAREEFPNLDLTVRGAISIGRRLMDPLAELVKIEAKSIGVGQYQHDVHQGKLQEKLDLTVASCVNKVGVNLNTASKHILNYISGLGPSLAKNIVEYRRSNGDFTTIHQLNKVPRLGEKAFEQAAGFLRIKNGTNPLDNTGVHPESYHIVQMMAGKSGLTVEQLIQSSEARKSLEISDFVTDLTGLPTLTDILKELAKPGLDPRGEAKQFSFDDKIRKIEDICEGMTVPGIVTNLTNFGAFVDIGVKQDGLLHISQITKKYIQNPSEVLHLGQELLVQITGVDVGRKRINLTLIF